MSSGDLRRRGEIYSKFTLSASPNGLSVLGTAENSYNLPANHRQGIISTQFCIEFKPVNSDHKFKGTMQARNLARSKATGTEEHPCLCLHFIAGFFKKISSNSLFSHKYAVQTPVRSRYKFVRQHPGTCPFDWEEWILQKSHRK